MKKKRRYKKLIIVILTTLISIRLLPIIFRGILILMLIIGHTPITTQIENSNYEIVDLHEATMGAILSYKEGPDIDNTIFNNVEDIYWNENLILIKCYPYHGINNYYVIYLDSCDMNYTLISPATFHNTLDWLKSNGSKMEHRHFES